MILSLPVIVDIRLTRVYILRTVVALISNTVLVPSELFLVLTQNKRSSCLLVRLVWVTESVTIVINVAFPESNTLFNNLPPSSEINKFAVYKPRFTF